MLIKKYCAIVLLLLFASSFVCIPSNAALQTRRLFYDSFSRRQLSAGWCVEDRGGNYSIERGILTITSSGQPYDSMTVYRNYTPQTGSFIVSARVKSTVLAGFALRVHAGPLPIFGSTIGAQLQFNSAESSHFAACWPTPAWHWETIYQPSETGVWYVLELIVQRDPLAVTYNVYSDSEVLLGTLTATSIVGFGYSDIHYVCLHVWSGPNPPVYHVDWVKIKPA